MESVPRWDLTKWLRSLQSVRLRRLQVPNLVHALGCLLVFCFVFSASLSLAGNMGLPHLCKVQQLQEQNYTHSHLCVQHFCVSKQWYGCQCLGFLTCTDVDACDCTQGLYRHCQRFCTESWPSSSDFCCCCRYLKACVLVFTCGKDLKPVTKQTNKQTNELPSQNPVEIVWEFRTD